MGYTHERYSREILSYHEFTAIHRIDVFGAIRLSPLIIIRYVVSQYKF